MNKEIRTYNILTSKELTSLEDQDIMLYSDALWIRAIAILGMIPESNDISSMERREVKYGDQLDAAISRSKRAKKAADTRWDRVRVGKAIQEEGVRLWDSGQQTIKNAMNSRVDETTGVSLGDKILNFVDLTIDKSIMGIRNFRNGMIAEWETVKSGAKQIFGFLKWAVTGWPAE